MSPMPATVPALIPATRATTGRARAFRAAVLAVALAVPMLVAVPAHATVTFACVASNANACTVTIPLSSDMNERVGSTMPDTHPWFLGSLGGNGVHAPYGLTGPGNPQTIWDGVGGATQGHVWSAILTTGSNEPAGGAAVLVFNHVNTIVSKHYKSFSVTAPGSAPRGTRIAITAVAVPKPPAGHLLLRRKTAGKWNTVATFSYLPNRKHWLAHLTLPSRKGVAVALQLRATKAPGLLTTDSPTFTIKTT